MADAQNILSQYFPDDHELIVRCSSRNADLNEMREHFEELAQLLRKNPHQISTHLPTDHVVLARCLEALRLEICEHLGKI